LAEAVAARDAFIAVAAHELRNPMTPMMGQIELLLSAVRAGKCPLEQVEQRLERIQHTIHRYVRRAEVLLNVSRLTSGQFQLDLERFDLGALLRDLAGEFAEAAQRTGVSIAVDVPQVLPGLWDRVAMEQIIDNLVSNSLKYGARTPIKLSAAMLGEELVRIEVRDHGPGIAAEDRARVFGRFERAVGQGKQTGGFGVGLWVVGQLVAAMDGTITVDDAPGGGALFTVTLPAHKKENQ
jgi:signal transduction histidine kinase